MISSSTTQDDQVPLQELRFQTLKRRWYMLLVCGLMGTLQVHMCDCSKMKNGLPHIPFIYILFFWIKVWIKEFLNGSEE